MVKAIIFDCFGVLATDTWLAFLDSLPEGTDLAQARALNKAFDRGIISEERFTSEIRDLTGMEPPILERLKPDQMTKNEALFDLIRTLKPDFAMGILSNISSDWITSTFLDLEEQKLFGAYVFSYQLGIIKPDQRIYILACERLRVAPHEALMVDDRELYVEGARAAGMSGILYEDLHSFKQQLNELLNTNY